MQADNPKKVSKYFVCHLTLAGGSKCQCIKVDIVNIKAQKGI